MAEQPMGANTIFIDVGKGPEAFTVTTDFIIPSSVIPELENVKIFGVLSQTSDVDNIALQQKEQSANQELPTPQQDQPVDKPTVPDEVTTDEQKDCIEIQTRRIKCPECPKYTAETQEKMLRHIRKVHRGENPFACLMCDYSTSNKTLFEEHVHIHQGIKPYKCSHCNHRSVSKKNLKKHELIHRPDNPLRCKFCSYIAHNKLSLNKHVRDDHVKSEATSKQFICDLCEFTTKNKKKWYSHTRHHKLITCQTRKCMFKTTCGVKFNEHVKQCAEDNVVNAEKFQCKVCGWSSKQDVKILLHLIHHPDQTVDESVVDISVLRKHGIMA